MCLHVISEEFTAKEDIKVYKIIDKNNESLLYGFLYKPNTLYRLRQKLLNHYNTIYEGFHAYIEKRSYSGSGKLVEFTIPKGAKYYLGNYGDIVSTSIRSGSLERI